MTTKTKLLIGAVILFGGLFAFNKINAEELSGQVTLGYTSDLYFRGSATDTSVKQGEIDASLPVFGQDIQIGAIINSKNDLKDEIRFSASTEFNFLDKIDTSFGVVSYNDNHVVGSTTELFIEIGAEIILDPKVKLFYDPGESGLTVEGSVSYDMDVTDNISVGSTAYIGNTTINNDSGIYYGVNLVAGYDLNDSARIFAGVASTDTNGTNFTTPDAAFFAGVSYQY